MQRSAIRISSSMMFCLALAFPCYLRAEGDAAKLYKANCAVCHAADGSGNTSSGKALKAKDLRSDEVQKQSDAGLAEITNKGQGKMLEFGEKLKSEQTQELLTYIRQLGT